MRDYEITVLFDAGLSEKDLDKEVKALQTLLESVGGKIKSKKDAEKKSTAYEINGQRQAYYVFVEVAMEADKVSGMDSKLKVNDRIVRYLIVKRD